MSKKLAFSIILGIIGICFATAQTKKSAEKGDKFITTRPFGFFLSGANIGYEHNLSRKSSFGIDLVSQTWLLGSAYPNAAINANIKYTFYGDNNQGWYIKAVGLAGMYFCPSITKIEPYYAGGSILIGGVATIVNRDRTPSRFSLYAELGLRYSHSFGHRPPSENYEIKNASMYHAFLSPGSFLAGNIGLRYRL